MEYKTVEITASNPGNGNNGNSPLKRSIIWSKDSEAFYKDLLRRTTSEYSKKFLETTFKEYLENEYPAKITKLPLNSDKRPEWARGKNDVHELIISQEDKGKFTGYLTYLDSYTEPITSTFHEFELNVYKWDSISNNQRKKRIAGERVFIPFGNGYRWIVITGNEALMRENNAMGHSIGKNRPVIDNGKIRIFSLRDVRNVPLITVEYNSVRRIINQAKEKDRKSLSSDSPYFRYFMSLVQTLTPNGISELKLQKNELLSLNKGLINLKDGEIAEGTVIIGDLTIDDPEVKELPRNLTIKGTLDLGESGIETVNRDTYASTLKVGVNTKSIVDGSHFPCIVLIHRKQLRVLPNICNLHMLMVPHEQTSSMVSINSLPRVLRVSRGIILNKMSIGILPDEIGSNKDIVLEDITSRDKIDSIYTSSTISLTRCRFTLPEHVDANTTILKDISKEYIPEGFSVDGHCSVKGTTVLPFKMRVEQDLVLDITPTNTEGEIEPLGDVYVGGNLVINGKTPLELLYSKKLHVDEGIIINREVSQKEKDSLLSHAKRYLGCKVYFDRSNS